MDFITTSLLIVGAVTVTLAVCYLTLWIGALCDGRELQGGNAIPYYKTCPHCGAHLDPNEKCNCRKAPDDEAFSLIMELTPAERHELLTKWKEKMASRSQTDQSTL